MGRRAAFRQRRLLSVASSLAEHVSTRTTDEGGRQ